MSGAVTGLRDRRPSWPTVAVLAVLLAFVDGFWIVSLQGAVGAIERTQSPFTRWLRDSTVMAVVMVGAVLLALGLARRWSARRNRSRRVAGVVAALAVVVLATAASVAQAGATSAYDYRLQSRAIGQMHNAHDHVAGLCGAVCLARQATVDAHLRGIGYLTLVLLVTNLVVVAWGLALRGGRLWAPARVSATGSDADPRPTVFVAGSPLPS